MRKSRRSPHQLPSRGIPRVATCRCGGRTFGRFGCRAPSRPNVGSCVRRTRSFSDPGLLNHNGARSSSERRFRPLSDPAASDGVRPPDVPGIHQSVAMREEGRSVRALLAGAVALCDVVRRCAYAGRLSDRSDELGGSERVTEARARKPPVDDVTTSWWCTSFIENTNVVQLGTPSAPGSPSRRSNLMLGGSSRATCLANRLAQADAGQRDGNWQE